MITIMIILIMIITTNMIMIIQTWEVGAVDSSVTDSLLKAATSHVLDTARLKIKMVKKENQDLKKRKSRWSKKKIKMIKKENQDDQQENKTKLQNQYYQSNQDDQEEK